ncbi:MAG: PEP-CTERM sorting domain-containing protein [Puniceicoccaceae bacterium]
MKKQIALLLSLALAGASSAQVVIYSFGESTEYSTGAPQLTLGDGTTAASNSDLSRAFSTNAMQPQTDYTGPGFFGGWEASDSLNQNMDFPPLINQHTTTGGFDGLYFTLNATASEAGSFALLMMADASTTVNFSDLQSFTLAAARTTGTGQNAIAHAVIRVGSSYYVADTPANNVSSAYGDISLALTSWNTYDPASSLSAIGSSATLNGTDQVDAVGYLLFRNVLSTNTGGNTRFGVGKFEVVAVPEPSTYALLAGFATLGLILFRRRQRL